MPSNPERPFGHDTLKLRAVFVPEDAKDAASAADISQALGHGSLKIPAIFVPEGGDRPSHPYQNFGKAVFSRVQDRDDGGTSKVHRPSWQSPDSASPSPDELWEALNSPSQSPDLSWQDSDCSSQYSALSSQSADSAQQGGRPDPMLPRTRFRFGTALSDSPPAPPNPTLARAKSDPLRQGAQISSGITAAGIAAWRSTANPAKTLRRSLAAPAPTQGEQGGGSAAAAGAPTTQLSVRDRVLRP